MKNRFLIPQATESAELCRLQSLRVPDEVALIGVDMTVWYANFAARRYRAWPTLRNMQGRRQPSCSTG